MKNRIKIWGSVLFLCLSLTICLVKGVQGQCDLDGKEDLTLINPEKLKIRQTSPIGKEKMLIKRIQFTTGHQKTLSHFFEGKRYFEQGVILCDQSDFSRAAEKFRNALFHLEKTNHIQSIVLTHLNLAICLQTLHQKEESLKHFNTALDLSRENGFKEYEAKALQGKGLILNLINEKNEAIFCLNKAIELHREIFDIAGEANDWLIKGIIERTRNTDRARSYFECALRISQDIGDPVLERKSYDYLDQLREYLFMKQSRGEEDNSFTL